MTTACGETEAWSAHVLSLDVQHCIKVIKHMRAVFLNIKQFLKVIKVYQKTSKTQFKDYCIWQNSSVNSLFAQMAWKDQKSNMNCFHKTFLILLRSRTINRQTKEYANITVHLCTGKWAIFKQMHTFGKQLIYLIKCPIFLWSN